MMKAQIEKKEAIGTIEISEGEQSESEDYGEDDDFENSQEQEERGIFISDEPEDILAETVPSKKNRHTTQQISIKTSSLPPSGHFPRTTKQIDQRKQLFSRRM